MCLVDVGLNFVYVCIYLQWIVVLVFVLCFVGVTFVCPCGFLDDFVVLGF